MAVIVNPALIHMTRGELAEYAERCRQGEPLAPTGQSEWHEALLARVPLGTTARVKLLRRSGGKVPRVDEGVLHTPGTLSEDDWQRAARGHEARLEKLQRDFEDEQ